MRMLRPAHRRSFNLQSAISNLHSHRSTTMAGTYLYGVVDVNGKGRGSWGAIGIGSPRREVYVVAEGDIGAVVSESPPPPLLPLREHVSAHQSVLERAMQRHTVLPFSFGTVADDDQLVRQFLAGNQDDFRDLLQRLKGKVEVGVKAFWSKESVMREVKEQFGDLEELNAEAARDARKGYQMAVRVGMAVEAVLNGWKSTIVEQACDELALHAEAVKTNPPFGVHMILNATFLMPRQQQRKFESAVYALDDRVGDRLNFRVAGPLPPYNFVPLRFTEIGAATPVAA
ncbi:MAG: hypothetical protein CO096_25615 [Armatimonadetes bacterium CG_4_9_14_3_um_filter_66_14]|nr:MAG: hypothetical protein CO096_25615 [Armatimonadetes bacterium CG_4_9_14_3_um_filter_66_14]